MDHSSDTSKFCSTGCAGITWWATLVIAVLAVPAFGVVVALMTGAASKGFFGVAIFIIACWLCTYLGMTLMKNPKMHEKIDISKHS